MNDAHGAPGRTSGRAQPRPAHNHGAHNHGAHNHGAQNTDDRDLLAGLGLEDKVRLLTGADNWRTCPLPPSGSARWSCQTARPGSAVRPWTNETRRRACPARRPSAPPGIPGWSGSSRSRSAPKPGARASTCCWRRPSTSCARRWAGAASSRSAKTRCSSPDGRGVRRRAAPGRGGRGGQALRGQRLRDAALDLRRADRRARPARAVPRPVRGLRARGRSGPGDDRLQHGQRRHHDRARAAAVGHPQGRVGVPGRGPVRLARRAQHGGDRGRRARPGHARPRGTVGRPAHGGGAGRRGQRGRGGRQGPAHPAAGPPGGSARPGQRHRERRCLERRAGARRPGAAPPVRRGGVHAAQQRGRRAAARPGHDPPHRADRAQRGQPGHSGRRQRHRPPGQRVDPGRRADRGAGRAGAPGGRAAGLRDLGHRARARVRAAARPGHRRARRPAGIPYRERRAGGHGAAHRDHVHLVGRPAGGHRLGRPRHDRAPCPLPGRPRRPARDRRGRGGPYHAHGRRDAGRGGTPGRARPTRWRSWSGPARSGSRST